MSLTLELAVTMRAADNGARFEGTADGRLDTTAHSVTRTQAGTVPGRDLRPCEAAVQRNHAGTGGEEEDVDSRWVRPHTRCQRGDRRAHRGDSHAGRTACRGSTSPAGG